MEYVTNYWVVSLHFCCNVFIYQKNVIYIIMIQIGAVGGDIWRIGSEKWGSRRGQINNFANVDNIQAQVLSLVLPLGTELDCCQSVPPFSNHILKVPPLGASVEPHCTKPCTKILLKNRAQKCCTKPCLALCLCRPFVFNILVEHQHNH